MVNWVTIGNARLALGEGRCWALPADAGRSAPLRAEPVSVSGLRRAAANARIWK